jgi:hypothetical protein
MVYKLAKNCLIEGFINPGPCFQDTKSGCFMGRKNNIKRRKSDNGSGFRENSQDILIRSGCI